MTFHHDSGRLVLSAHVLTTEFYASVGEEGARKMGRERRALSVSAGLRPVGRGSAVSPLAASRRKHWPHKDIAVRSHAGALKLWASLETPLALTEEQEPLRSVIHRCQAQHVPLILAPGSHFTPPALFPSFSSVKTRPWLAAQGEIGVSDFSINCFSGHFWFPISGCSLGMVLKSQVRFS